MKDIAVEKSELIITAMSYAQKHKLDLNKKDDVKKILEAIDPGHTNEKEVDEFFELLQNADKFLTMKAARKSKERKILN